MPMHANFLDSRPPIGVEGKLRGNDDGGAYISLSVIPVKTGIQGLRPGLIEMLRFHYKVYIDLRLRTLF